MLERLTLEPFTIVAVHPHDHGVSPGHSGVDAERLMLMSRSLTISIAWLCELLCSLHDFVYGETQMLIELLVGGRRTEAMQSECDTIRPNPSLP